MTMTEPATCGALSIYNVMLEAIWPGPWLEKRSERYERPADRTTTGLSRAQRRDVR